MDPDTGTKTVTVTGADAGSAPELPRGTSIGRYLLLDVIGSGGMGVVYAAFDPKLDRKVAIKLVRQRASTAESAQEAARIMKRM